MQASISWDEETKPEIRLPLNVFAEWDRDTTDVFKTTSQTREMPAYKDEND